MSKTIVFAPEIEKKLKRLKIKTKFVKYWLANKWKISDPNYNRHIATLEEKDNNWYNFIGYSFNWSLTEEGKDYWNNIANNES
jgi:hypothetical protein